MELRQPVDGRAEKVRPRVIEAVPARVISGVAEPEIWPEVDHRRAASGDVGDDGCRGSVGQGQEDSIDRGQCQLHREPRVGKMGMRRADRLAVAVATLEPHDLDIGLAAEEPNQLGPDVPRRADDPDPDASIRGRSAAQAGLG